MATSASSIAEIAGANRGGLKARFYRDLLFHGLHRARTEILLASLAINFLGLALPIAILHIYDRVLPNQTHETLILLIVGVAVALVLDALLRLARAYVNGWAAARIEHDLNQRLMGHMLGAKLANFERVSPGVHLERMSSVDLLRDFYSGQATLVLIDLPFAILFLALIAYLAGPLVLVPLTIIVVIAVVAARTGRALRAAIEVRDEVDERRYSFIMESLTGIHTLKAMAMETQMLRRYERLQESSAAAGYDVVRLNGRAQAIGAVASGLTVASLVGLGSLLVIGGALTIGGLTACTMLAGRSLQPLLRAMGVWTQFQNVRIARDRYTATLEIEQEGTRDAKALPKVTGGIYFYGVRYTRPGEREPLLNGLNLRVEPCTTIGIRGGDGNGKSVLLEMIQGITPPSGGRIMLDNHMTAAYDPVSIRRQITYVPQHGVLFRGTILENIAKFRTDDAVERALEVAQELGLDRIVARLPKGYETQVGDGSVEKLPGGVIQRIAITRALAEPARIILHDEAESHLDLAGFELYRNALAARRESHTIVIVSNRPELLSLADQVYSLHDGRLMLRALPAPVTVNQPPNSTVNAA